MAVHLSLHGNRRNGTLAFYSGAPGAAGFVSTTLYSRDFAQDLDYRTSGGFDFDNGTINGKGTTFGVNPALPVPGEQLVGRDQRSYRDGKRPARLAFPTGISCPSFRQPHFDCCGRAIDDASWINILNIIKDHTAKQVG